MRTSAPITAILALASLLSTPAALRAAKPAHRTAAHKAASVAAAKSAPAAKKKSRKKAADTTTVATTHSTRRHRSKKHDVSETPAPVTVERIRGTKGRRRKATSEDFVKAAKAAPKSSTASLRDDDLPAAPPDRSIVAKATEPAANESRVARSHESDSDETTSTLATPIILPTLYNKRGRLVVPPPLKGSHEILVRQNVVADRDGLDRIQDDDDLERMRSLRLLVPIPTSNALTVDDRLPVNRRYSRPWTAQFLNTLARAHYARFHTALQVNSAVRTVEFQQRLMRTNGNAAPAEGETASPHLTGQAIDIAKHGLSITEIAWLRGYLLPLIQQGRIDVEEEFQQACFHISVYKKYAPSSSAPRRSIAATRHSGTSTLAASLP